MLRKLDITLFKQANAENAIGWLSNALSTITSDVFTELAVRIPPFYGASEYQVRAWNPIDDVLDRFNPRVGVTLIVRLRFWPVGDEFKDLVKLCFPSMWKNGKVVIQVSSQDIQDALLGRAPETHLLEIEY